ncbi:MAG: hypothetical protein AAFV98_13300 [Chloroflexota bacterium]
MCHKSTIYLAVSQADQALADVLLAHIKHRNLICKTSADMQESLANALDMHKAMNEADMLVLIDSHDFRQQQPNHELQFAQTLEKPLVVISLHQKVDESRSTWRVRLFDFTNPRHRTWRQVIETINNLANTLHQPADDPFLI